MVQCPTEQAVLGIFSDACKHQYSFGKLQNVVCVMDAHRFHLFSQGVLLCFNLLKLLHALKKYAAYMPFPQVK